MATDGSEEVPGLTLLWKIENRKLKEGEDSKGVPSPLFRSGVLEGKKFHMYFDPRGPDENNECMKLKLALWDNTPGFRIDVQWSFVGNNGSTLVDGTVQNQFMRPFRYFDFPNVPTYQEMFVTRKSEFFSHNTLTVRCRMWKSAGNLSAEEFICCRTRAEFLENSFIWPIPRFSTLALNREVTTPVTIGDSLEKDNFLIKFCLKGESLEDARIHVELIPVTISELLGVKLKMTVLDNGRKFVKCAEREYSKMIRPDAIETLALPEFVSRKNLLVKKMDCLKNDTLTLRCEISVIKITRIIEKSYFSTSKLNLDEICDPPDVCLQGRASLDALAEDFLKLYKDQNFFDFKLRSGDVSFPVLRNVLVARSPVFKKMFSSDMKESESDCLDIPDLDYHTLNRMLTFFYTGTLEPDLQWQDAAKLYYAADKYEVQSLKQHCSTILCSEIVVSNVCDILSLADRHQDKGMTSFVYEFLINHFDEVIHSKEWESFMESDLALAGKTMFQLYKEKQSKGI